MGIGQKLLNTPIPRFNVIHNRIDLYSVARREQDAFLDSGIRTQTREGFTKTAFGNRQPLSNLDRSSLMT